MLQFRENVWTVRRTDGQTLFHSILPATAGDSKNRSCFTAFLIKRYILRF